MRIALLGIDEPLWQIATAAAGSQEHTVVVACEAGERAAELMQLFPAARLESEWESLTLGDAFDLLAVGGSAQVDRQRREEQLRRLVQAEVPLLVVIGAADAIVLHELAMIQADTQSLLAAWNPLRSCPAMEKLLELVRDDTSLGDVSQVTMQRHLPDTSPAAVASQLVMDADVLRSIAGELDRVTALAPQRDDGTLAGMAVTFAGPDAAVVQWNLQSGTETAARLGVQTAGGQAVLDIRGMTDAWELSVQTPDGRQQDHAIETPSEPMVLAVLETCLTGEARPAGESRAAGPSTWTDAYRAAELSEAAQESLRRGRTIQLHFEEHSEQQTFKGVMAIGGCLILLGVLVVLAAGTVIDAARPELRDSVWWRLWPLYVFAPVMLFLLLQSLWRVFASDAVPSQRGGPDSND